MNFEYVNCEVSIPATRSLVSNSVKHMLKVRFVGKNIAAKESKRRVQCVSETKDEIGDKLKREHLPEGQTYQEINA